MKRWGVLALFAAVAAGAVDAKTQPVIHAPSDLPDTRFVLSGPASEAFMSPTFLRDTVPALRQEAERLLATYRIEDPAVTQRLRGGLISIAILQGRPADARRLIAEQRALEIKPQLKAIGFLTSDAIAAELASPDRPCAAAGDQIAALLKNADPIVVRDEVLVRYARSQTDSVGFYAGTAGGMIDPEQKVRGSVDILQGLLLATFRAQATYMPPCRAQIATALKTWLDAPANLPVDVWRARLPRPELFATSKPVTVAIWESGFDTSLFPGQMAVDPAEPLDGKDNDGNGIVDDVNGPTYDYNIRPTQAALPVASPWLAARLGLQMAVEKGQLDLNYGADTPEARFFALRAREASTQEQTDDVRGETEFMARTHATWVASVVADDAPFIRLYNANVYPYGANPDAMPVLEADIDRWIAAMPRLASRLKGGGVRIVNMSWEIKADEFTDLLLSTGAEADADKAKLRGEAMASRMRAALWAFIQSCPDILFVASAGNANQLAGATDASPQSFDLPNILVVGATGMNGRPTSFTSFGKFVKVYAPGEGITVRAPGGMVMRASGTSFSAPLTARAAAQMLAVCPGLTPSQLIAGLIATASVGEGDLKLIDPSRAVAWATEH
ncbi:S8 family serine peptidase [Asticcacaulis sp. 201]|uniref:S8 family serine peptidase n=1 Tax=Asticcacaulis sp. 201 TaxID=3028787 RepID=UPI0029162C4B|nr:S8 family serine peptidase [Asticcacaulis sp. 201]MDV6330101.1 S8 family serine peptidase [Asticcacaulis sp. 201]